MPKKTTLVPIMAPAVGTAPSTSEILNETIGNASGPVVTAGAPSPTALGVGSGIGANSPINTPATSTPASSSTEDDTLSATTTATTNTNQPATSTTTAKPFYKEKWFVPVVIVGVLVLAGAAWYFFKEKK